MKYLELNDGLKIPSVGMGTYQIKDQETMDNVIKAGFDAGYEYFDTARVYENEKILGNALKNAPVKREDYKLATKVWPTMFGTDLTKKSIDDSLKDLQVDYVDVIHLHWFGKYFEEAWKVFEDYKRQGIVKSIAVCNFERPQIEKLMAIGEAPSMDQLESSPHFSDEDYFNYLKENKIIYQAWSPLARGRSGLLDEKVLLDIAKKHGKSPAQIALKWNVQRGAMVIPKSVNPVRIKENISLFDFELDESDMEEIKTVNKNMRYSHSPQDSEWLDEISRK